MNEEYLPEKDLYAVFDETGFVREISHRQAPVEIDGAEFPLDAARIYLEEYSGLLRIESQDLSSLDQKIEVFPIDEGVAFRHLIEEGSDNLTTVGFIQSCFGVPVWESGISVQVKHGPLRVIALSSSAHMDIDAQLPENWNHEKISQPSIADLEQILGITSPKQTNMKVVEVYDSRYGIYRYERLRRQQPHTPEGDDPGQPTLQLPPVDERIKDGRHYLVVKVSFEIVTDDRTTEPWIAMVEVETESVLQVRAMVSGVTGKVFHTDPVSNSGQAGHGPTAADAVLISDVTIRSLAVQPSALNVNQTLVGDHVVFSHLENPAANPPTEPHLAGASTAQFEYPSHTHDFGAVNAFYHCTRFLNEIAPLGIAGGNYFRSNDFKLQIDHAAASSKTMLGAGNTIRVTFKVINTAIGPISEACSWRVVLHELGGHAILLEYLGQLNFGFAHSAGDSIAAIYNDPDSNILGNDRNKTFPWIVLNEPRFHNRNIADGWAWGGDNDHPFAPLFDQFGYLAEQILSTTLFNTYKALGGDSPNPANKRFASMFTVRLILRAVASLTQAITVNDATGFVTALEVADSENWIAEGHYGGAYNKVLRWAFEKQGLYKPANPANVNAAGLPPAIDVYIDDGRIGEYGYQAVFWNCQDIWNRHANDGGTAHQQPIVGIPNFAYVRIKNRGSQNATNVQVRGFHCAPSSGLIWPNDWQPMAPPIMSTANVPPNNSASVIAGPFQWTPSQLDHECMLMIVSAAGDVSNADRFGPQTPIPEWRLVPHDNNIGQRNVSPVAAAGGASGLTSAFNPRRFMVRYPLVPPTDAEPEEIKPVDIEIVVELPPFLADLGWRCEFVNPDGGRFTLESGTTKEVAVVLDGGLDFAPDDVKQAEATTIHLLVLADGMLVGGMSYELDADLKGIADE